jgi:hypothetical protein
MSVKLQMEKLAKPGEVLEENKKIGELEEMLKERAEELQVIESSVLHPQQGEGNR